LREGVERETKERVSGENEEKEIGGGGGGEMEREREIGGAREKKHQNTKNKIVRFSSPTRTERVRETHFAMQPF